MPRKAFVQAPWRPWVQTDRFFYRCERISFSVSLTGIRLLFCSSSQQCKISHWERSGYQSEHYHVEQTAHPWSFRTCSGVISLTIWTITFFQPTKKRGREPASQKRAKVWSFDEVPSEGHRPKTWWNLSIEKTGSVPRGGCGLEQRGVRVPSSKTERLEGHESRIIPWNGDMEAA